MISKTIACGVIFSAILVGCNKDNSTAPSPAKTDAQIDSSNAKTEASNAAQSAADATKDAASAAKNSIVAATEPSATPATTP